jgi:hypothetical protein
MTTTTAPGALDALNRVVDVATGFCRAQTFFTACTLGVFDALDYGVRRPRRSRRC